MELRGVVIALESLHHSCYVTLYCDFMPLIAALKYNWLNMKMRGEKLVANTYVKEYLEDDKLIKLWYRLYIQSRIHKIEPIWIRGHQKTNPHEYKRCDHLARRHARALKRLQCFALPGSNERGDGW